MKYQHGTSVIVPLILGQMEDESLVVGLAILEKGTSVGYTWFLVLYEHVEMNLP
jgi:hypothetical protein